MDGGLEDDPSIAGDTLLYRRVVPRWIVADGNRNCQRLATGAFQGVEMSVGVGDTLGADPAESLLEGQPDDVCLVAFEARVAREIDQAVCRAPKDDDPAHGLVVGKKTDAKQRTLARSATWAKAPDDACVPPYE